MFNGKSMLYQLLLPGISEGATLAPELDIDTVDHYPFWTFRDQGGESLYSRSDVAPKAWDWSLNLSLFHTDEDEAMRLAGDMYDFVHSWNETFLIPPTHTVDGVGTASSVTDDFLFSKVASAEIPGHTLTHLAGGFSLQLHQA